MGRNFTPVRLAYKKYEPIGSDGSIPVIFLHGLSVSKEHWGDIPQTIANKTKRKTYVLDARNHGDSEWSNEFDFDIIADDLLHFLDTVGEKKAVLVGHSMGGITAMKAALEKPERIEKIIVEDMYAKKIPSEFAPAFVAFLTYMQKVIQQIPPELGEEEAKQFCVDEFLKSLPKELKEFVGTLNEEGKAKPHFFALKRDSRGSYTSNTNFDALLETMKKPEELQSELSGRYDGEAHFIYGTLSPFNVPEDADNIRRLFPKAEFTGIEKASHDVHQDRPEQFTDVLLKSLS